jgi:ribosomal protein L24
MALVHKDGKPARVRFEMQDGKKVRVATRTNEVIS